jgi:hypothetical protein
MQLNEVDRIRTIMRGERTNQAAIWPLWMQLMPRQIRMQLGYLRPKSKCRGQRKVTPFESDKDVLKDKRTKVSPIGDRACCCMLAILSPPCRTPEAKLLRYLPCVTVKRGGTHLSSERRRNVASRWGETPPRKKVGEREGGQWQYAPRKRNGEPVRGFRVLGESRSVEIVERGGWWDMQAFQLDAT